MLSGWKTLIFNGLTILVMLGSYAEEAYPLVEQIPSDAAPFVIVASLANILLRFITKTPIFRSKP